VIVRLGGRGKASEVELGQTRTKGAQLFHLRCGKVTRFVSYLDGARALADLGLAPEGVADRGIEQLSEVSAAPGN
jgi:hypothetical protein